MGHTYAQCLQKQVKGGRLLAVALGKRARSLATTFHVDAEPSMEMLLKRDDVNAVIIATPESVHAEETLAAAAAGKHVLVEKPMAPDLRQCDAMANACEKAGKLLMQVKHWRFRGVHRRAREIIDSGRLGKILQLQNWTYSPLELCLNGVQQKPFYLDPAGGGYFMGWNTHNFDFVRWIAGSEARRIFARVQSSGNHPLADLSTMAQVDFANGVTAQVWVNAEMPVPQRPEDRFRTRVVCESGVLDLAGSDYLDLGTSSGWKRVWTQPPFDSANPADPHRLEAYALMVQEFIDAIHEGRQPSVGPKDGRAAVELCLAARRSSQTGQAVELPLDSAPIG